MSAAWNARTRARREHERRVIALLPSPKPEPHGSLGWLALGDAEQGRRWCEAEAQLARAERDSSPPRDNRRDASKTVHIGRQFQDGES